MFLKRGVQLFNRYLARFLKFGGEVDVLGEKKFLHLKGGPLSQWLSR